MRACLIAPQGKEFGVESMEYKIKHIGLQVNEKDVKNFYGDILGFEAERSFYLSKEETNDIFQYEAETKIIFGKCKGMEVELFVHNATLNPCFSHICFFAQDAKEIAAKAAAKGYRTFIRRKNDKETFFISDGNRQVFEIKNQ